MKAITTKYLPYTATKPSRIKAYDMDGNQVTMTYPQDNFLKYKTADLGEYECHKIAAQALLDKMNWQHNIIGGGIKGGYVWVMLP